MSGHSIKFLTIDDVLRLHAIAIADQGGDPMLLDRGKLESALAQPHQQFNGEYLHPDIPSMAAAYAFHICQNHPFADGNKRAAFAAMLAFLLDNGWAFDANEVDAAEAMLAIAAGERAKDQVAGWLKSQSHEKPSIELRDFLYSLPLDEVMSWIQSTNQGSDAERTVSAREAAAALPVMAQVVTWCDGLLEELRKCDQPTAEEVKRWMGDIMEAPEPVRTFAGIWFTQGAGTLLAAFYRIAEDMGYEW